MPKTKVVFYKEDEGSVPILEWLDTLQPKVLDKCTVRIERLEEMGHELRRPEADFLRGWHLRASSWFTTRELSDVVFFSWKGGRRSFARFSQAGRSSAERN